MTAISLSSPPDAMAAVPATRNNFFRYHGVWAPGVRMFRSLRFRTKAWIVSFAFAAPLVMVGQQWFAAQSEAIAFAARERLGTEYAQRVIALVPLVQQQRWLAMKGTGKDDPAQAAALQGQFDEAYKALDAVQARLGAELGTEAAYNALLAARAAATPAADGLEKAFDSHGSHVKALHTLLNAVSDGSNLTLDPDLDTYYLMDAAFGEIPTLAEATARMRALGSTVLVAGTVAPKLANRLAADEVLGDEFHERLVADLGKVIGVHPELANALEIKPASEAMHKLHDQVAAMPDAATILALGDAAGAGFFTLQKNAAAELDRLLQERIAGVQARRAAVAGLIALCLLASAYLFYCFALVINGGLQQLRTHIERMAVGDMTHEPNAWGSDEVGDVLDCLSDMRSQLAGTIGTIRGAADQVATASAQLSAGTLDLARRTEETAANLERSASAMEQMQSAVRSTADTTQEVATLAQHNAAVAARGGDVIAQAVTTMQEIQSASSKVADIIGVIDGIAFQTNILALNAAVEAARAGEQGKGFAVVAGEVRSLAQRSAAAAREIKSLIDSSVLKTESGAAVVQQAGQTMRDIVDSVGRINELLADVASATREQTDGISHVNATVAQLDKATQQNAALVEQASASAQSMNEQANALSAVVAHFQLMRAA